LEGSGKSQNVKNRMRGRAKKEVKNEGISNKKDRLTEKRSTSREVYNVKGKTKSPYCRHSIN